MKLTALIPLLSFLINHILMVKILSNYKRHFIYYSTLLFMSYLSITLFISFLMWSITTYSTLLFLTKLQIIFWLPLGFLFLNYIYDLIEIKRPIYLYIGGLITLIFSAIAAFTPYLVPAIEMGPILPRGIHTLSFMIGFTILTPTPALYGIYLLFKNLNNIKHKTPIFLRYLFVVSTFVLLFGSAFIFYLPFILKKQFLSIGLNIVLPVSITIYFTTKYVTLESIDNKSTAQFLFNEISDGIILIDNNDYIIQINPNACKLFKTTEEETLDKHISTLIKSSDYSPKDTYFDQRLVIDIDNNKIPIKLKQTTLNSWKNNIYGKLILIKSTYKEKKPLVGTIQKIFK